MGRIAELYSDLVILTADNPAGRMPKPLSGKSQQACSSLDSARQKRGHKICPFAGAKGDIVLWPAKGTKISACGISAFLFGPRSGGKVFSFVTKKRFLSAFCRYSFVFAVAGRAKKPVYTAWQKQAVFFVRGIGRKNILQWAAVIKGTVAGWTVKGDIFQSVAVGTKPVIQKIIASFTAGRA